MTVTIDGTAGITFPQGATQIVGAGPAFNAWMSASQTVTSGVETKVPLNSETFDTNNNFDTSTYRFTPTVPGYYCFSWITVGRGSTSLSAIYAILYKNGSAYQYGGEMRTTLTANTNNSVSGSTIAYMNGTTDYVELYVSITGTGTISALGTQGATLLTGYLVRGA